MKRYLMILGLLVATAFFQGAGASRFDRLYEVQVPVADQSAAERNRALEAALGEVVVRVSGTREAARSGGLPSDPGQVDRLVQQYGYLVTPDGLQLQVRFEPAATDQVLRQMGLPVWGNERPTTLVWLAVQDGAERRLVGADEPGAAGDALRRSAQRRAVPVILPLLDLEDQSRVRFGDVWGGFFDSVLTASRRYGADAVLIGRLQRQSGGWGARWTLYDRNQTRQWDENVGDLSAAAALGVDGLADALAASYAGSSTAAASLDRVRVRVDDVRNLDDYAQLSNFLRSREFVSDAQLLAVSGDQAVFELELRGAPDLLRRSLRLWERLAQIEPVTGNGGAELHYRLVP